MRIEVHSSDLTGTCDQIGECSTRDEQLTDLSDTFEVYDQAVLDAIRAQREELCKAAGRCTMYFGLREERPQVRTEER